jgi:hypothetical protein
MTFPEPDPHAIRARLAGRRHLAELHEDAAEAEAAELAEPEPQRVTGSADAGRGAASQPRPWWKAITWNNHSPRGGR